MFPPIRPDSAATFIQIIVDYNDADDGPWLQPVELAFHVGRYSKLMTKRPPTMNR